MKSKPIQLAILLILTLLLSPSDLLAQKKNEKGRKKGKQNETIQLFNGKDLSNWTFYLKDPAVDPSKVFTVQNGVIHITGDPFGYMKTKETYSDYKLHVEWRWPAEATNSGVFVHAQKKDTIWVKCIECQLMAGKAGDFVCMPGATMKEQTDKTVWSVKKMAESSEKPVGEWNTMEVICKGNTIEVHVNGVLQNKGTEVNVTSGSICLQSEGKAIEFRNVNLNRIK